MCTCKWISILSVTRWQVHLFFLYFGISNYTLLIIFFSFRMQYRTALHFISFSTCSISLICRWYCFCCAACSLGLHYATAYWMATTSSFILRRNHKWSSLRIYSFISSCSKCWCWISDLESAKESTDTQFVHVCLQVHENENERMHAHRDTHTATHNQLCAPINNINNNYWKVHDIGLNCGFSLYGVVHTSTLCVCACAMMCCG